MKIALFTWFHYRNYGTALQVTALAEIIRKLDYDIDIVDYRPSARHPSSVADYTVSAILKRFFSKSKKYDDYDDHIQFCDDAQDNAFSTFLDKRLSFSPKCFTLSDLHELNNNYDAFVCGSDQIWSPLCFDSHYFLDFVSDTDKMIAYAPSIGSSTIKDMHTKDSMKKLISRFKHLSVRESKGKELIKNLTGQNAEIVCDPTILLTGDEWRNFCNASREKDRSGYILVYMLGYNESHWDDIISLSKEKGLQIKIIPVYTDDINRDGCIDSAVGPSEFVSLIDNAELVCTDSFHGMVFSLLLNKDFVPYERFSSKDPKNQNSRIYSLLNMVGLSKKLIKYDGKRKQKYDLSIDYTLINPIIESFRECSKNYLTNALKVACSSNVPQTKKHVLSKLDLCCGCGACENVCPVSAIRTKLNKEGFIKAEIFSEICINCGKCLSVCPFLGVSNGTLISKSELYSYKDNDINVLKTSSSGGFAYSLSKLLIENGYSIVGCTFDKSTQRAKHIMVDSVEDLHRLQGSKYMQSNFSAVIKVINSCKSPIAIFGTPCQIAAARKLFKDRIDIIYIDLICLGVPSYNLYRKYIDFLSEKFNMDPKKISPIFRYKQKESKERHLFSTDGTNSVCFSEFDDPYYRIFKSCGSYSDSCYNCRWRDCSEADLRIGDYWGERFQSDKSGVSMVSVLNECGKKVLNMLLKKDCAEIQKYPVEDYFKSQQTALILTPLYRDELVDKLADNSYSLEFLADKYAFNPNKSLNVKERFVRMFKIYVSDRLYERRKNKTNDT